MKDKYVSTKPISGSRDSAGVGYVTIPEDQITSKYIQHCYRTGTISIALENGGVIDKVIITKSALKDIEFPDSYLGLGTQVFWVNQPRKNIPIVVGCLSKTNELVNYGKDKSTLSKSTIKGVAEISVDSENRVVMINSTSFSEKGGDIYLIASNNTRKSKINIKAVGSVNIESDNFTITNTEKLSFTIKNAGIDDKITQISYEKGGGFSYKDEFGNEFYLNDSNIQFKPSSKFNIGEGKEPLLLGQTTQTELNKDSSIIKEILEVLKTPILEPGNGNPSAFQAALLNALSNLPTSNYSDILSQISNTD